MDERFDEIDDKLGELSDKLEELSDKLDELSDNVDNISGDIETDVETAVEDAVYGAVENAISDISVGQPPLITVFSQDKKFILPVYAVEARRLKKEQDPYGIYVQYTQSGSTRVVGKYPNKEAALAEMKELAEAINLSTVNRTKFYKIK